MADDYEVRPWVRSTTPPVEADHIGEWGRRIAERLMPWTDEQIREIQRMSLIWADRERPLAEVWD
jgi:hypothetical protein